MLKINKVSFEKLAFYTFLLSTIFIITSSNNAINDWPFPWNQISITVACLLPVFLVIIAKAFHWLHEKEIQPEIYFIPLIIFLGILNVVFGERLLPNFKGMGLFLLSGISVFAAAIFILKSYKAQTVLFWLYTIIIVILAIHAIFALWWHGSYKPLFSNNPIPESALITLLLTGPLILLDRQNNIKTRRILVFCFLLGIATILILFQRAPIISLFIIVLMLGFLLINRFWIYFLCISVMVIVSLKIVDTFSDELPDKTQKVFQKVTKAPIYRAEMLTFAYHIIKKKPFFGTGLWVPLDNHLYDYNQKIFNAPYSAPNLFHSFVKAGHFGNTSFHNFVLCMLVQMGGFLTLAYIGLLYLVFSKAFKSYKTNPKALLKLKLLMILLTGFCIQSMAVDSLMYPDINFVFHSILGVLVNCNWETKEKVS